MTLVSKLYRINSWFKQNYLKVYEPSGYTSEEIIFNELSGAASANEIIPLEQVLKENIPQELLSLLQAHNGEPWSGTNTSPFFSHNLLSCKEMVEQINFGLSLIKSNNRHVSDIEKSNQLISQIVTEVKSKLNLSEDWHKITFLGGNRFRMPAIYKNELNLKEKESVVIEHQEANGLIKLLQETEKQTYEWDDIDFIVYSDGRIDVQRNVFDWNSGISGSDADAVKPIYFHYKWVPVFGDGGGNYIGIDLDPGLIGKKGQVIIYGRDVYQNYKVADSLEHLFDKILADLEDETKSILLKDKKIHFQERLKSL